MAHEHTHDHSHAGTYYVDQLCTIASCGALGGVAVMMYATNRLGLILAEQFFLPVLIGGIALLALVAIRALTLWREAGQATGHTHEHEHHHHHDHDHEHDECCDHDHSHKHAHAHDHGHEHGWTPARYAVLMLPIALYFLNLPNSSFSQEMIGRILKGDEVEGGGSVATKEGVVLGFKELANAAHYPDTRAAMEGKTGRLAGMYSPLRNDKQFTLFRLDMTCCAADTVPVEVIIVCDENITRIQPRQWVEAEGQIQFRKAVGRGEKYTPVLYLKSADQVKPTHPRTGFEV